MANENIEKNKGGRPRLIETPDELMEHVLDHYKKKSDLVTITSFMIYLKEKKIIKNMTYWYDLNEEFSETKKEIEMLMEQRYIELSIDKDNATSFLIFYGKNKFGYTDRLETHNTNVELPTINLVEED
jgi:predicted transcriptional regulator